MAVESNRTVANQTQDTGQNGGESTFAGELLKWTGTGDWGIIASEIALWTIISMSVVYSISGLLLGMRYYQHAHFKSRQKSAIGVDSSFRATITKAGAAAGVQIWMVGVAVSIPVIYTLIGVVVGFFMGMTIGSLLAGILLYSSVAITFEMQVTVGLFISILLLFFSAAPPSVSVIFL